LVVVVLVVHTQQETLVVLREEHPQLHQALKQSLQLQLLEVAVGYLVGLWVQGVVVQAEH
jgi:hypothetical protein